MQTTQAVVKVETCEDNCDLQVYAKACQGVYEDFSVADCLRVANEASRQCGRTVKCGLAVSLMMNKIIEGEQ